MSLTGKVRMGVIQKDGQNRPFIRITLDTGKRIEFICTVSCDTLEEARDMCEFAHEVLRAEPKDLKYSRTGLKDEGDA